MPEVLEPPVRSARDFSNPGGRQTGRHSKNVAIEVSVEPRVMNQRQGACSGSPEKEKPQGGPTARTRGLAGLVGRELRSLTALLVERNGAQKTPCQALWGKATASALCKVRPACGPECRATTPRITF